MLCKTTRLKSPLRMRLVSDSFPSFGAKLSGKNAPSPSDACLTQKHKHICGPQRFASVICIEWDTGDDCRPRDNRGEATSTSGTIVPGDKV